MRLEADGDARSARRERRLAAGIAVGENDAIGRCHFDDLAGRLGAAGIADEHAAARPGVDGRAGAPPGGPARRVGEEAEDEIAWRADDDGAIETVWEWSHDSLVLFGEVIRRRRLAGRGPRRDASSS